MFELLKEKQTGIFVASIMILIMFFQIIGRLLNLSNFEWQDPYFLEIVQEICNYLSILKAIEKAESQFFYWAFLIFAMAYILIIIVLLIYMNYFLNNRQHYVEAVVRILRSLMQLMFWVFYMPFFEIFISIAKCEDGYHYLQTSMQCNEGLHIFFTVLCFFFVIILFSGNLVIALLYNEQEPVQEDSLSRMETSSELLLVIYRSIIVSYCDYCDSEVCNYVLVAVYIISGVVLSLQYYKYLPYYNSFISVLVGSLIFNYLWISVNALLVKLLNANGQIIIILIGVPIITVLAQNIRKRRIENLMKTNMDKLKLGSDALLQIHNMTDYLNGFNKNENQKLQIVGIINLHVIECQNQDCPCKDSYELFDIMSNQYVQRNKVNPHLDNIFLNHLIK